MMTKYRIYKTTTYPNYDFYLVPIHIDLNTNYITIFGSSNGSKLNFLATVQGIISLTRNMNTNK